MFWAKKENEPFPTRFLSGRGDWIRTSDPLTPSQVRYQAALRPEDWGRISTSALFVKDAHEFLDTFD